MTAKYVEFNFKARYHVLGDPSQNIEEIIYVIHGYGQLSQYFIRKFSSLEKQGRLIIAPEGLSRFYLAGFDGRIGATWMTREDRETDIANYVSYLDQIHLHHMNTFQNVKQVSVIGFSQGAATATRWLTNGQIEANKMILWAGILPYDLNISKAPEKLGHMKRICVYGKNDPYLNDAKMKEMTDLSGRTGLDFEYHTFDGAHDIDTDLLNQLF